MIDNWPNIYDVSDGSMPGCRGADCETSCCDEKKLVNTRRRIVPYNTILKDPGERDYLRFIRPDLKSAGIVFQDVLTEINGVRRNLVVMRGCLGDDGCKLGDFKPVACKMFPFRLSEDKPIDTRCPHAMEIASNAETMTFIDRLRQFLG